VNDVIELRELRVSAIVGVLAEERTRTQPLVFDLDLVRPFEVAAINDDIAGTTNYADVLALTSRTATEGRYLLLETLAYRVAHEILTFDEEIASVTVAVRKVRPPVAEDVSSVGVRCTVARA
jgi:7,8-dihydroneopterin aldolase/epimerase/oxygenase